MSKITLGNCPDSWGVWYPNDPKNISWSTFLDEVAEAGYSVIELGSQGYLPTKTEVLKPELDKRGLRVSASTIVGCNLLDDEWVDRLIASLPETLNMQKELGAQYVVLLPGLFVDGFCGDRVLPRVIDAEKRRHFTANIERIGKTVADHGLTLTVHPHAETYLEKEPEIEEFLNATDPRCVSLCIDVGHHAYGGGDIHRFLRKYRDRVPYLHIKNCDQAVLDEMKEKNWSYAEAVQRDLMCCEAGTGMVDYKELKRTLDDIGYDGFMIVEESMYPTPPERPMPVAKKTREYLNSIGIGS